MEENYLLSYVIYIYIYKPKPKTTKKPPIQFLNLYQPVLTEIEALCQGLMIQFYTISFFSQIQIFRGTNNLLHC